MIKHREIHTTDAQFEAIWAVLGKSKEGTKTITVPKDALMAVMMDHANMFGALFPNHPPIKARG